MGKTMQANPKRPFGKGSSMSQSEIRQKARTWAPATGIKQPVLSVFTNRMRHDGWGMCRKTIAYKAVPNATKWYSRRKPMFKGSRVPQIAAHKAYDGGAKVRG